MDLRLALRFRPPYDAVSALRALAAHDVPGMQTTNEAARSHTRVLRTPDGPAVATIVFGAGHVDVRLDAHTRLRAWLERTIRRWLDLDLDPRHVAATLAGDAIIGPLLTARPGLRVLGCTDGFEAAMGTVLGQQVSIAAGRTFAGRLVAAYGDEVGAGFRAFPAPAVVAVLRPEELQRSVGVTGARARTLVALAQTFAAGFELGEGTDAEVARTTLLALPGIGPWTVDTLRMRVLRECDAFPAGDLVLRRALGVTTAKDVEAAAQGWRPFRAYATFHLWTQVAYGGRFP